MAGTAEVVVLELAKVLQPVGDRLAAPGGLEALFADLGLPLPQPVRDAADVVAAAGAAAAAVGEVAPLIGPLAAAVAARDEGAAAAALTALLPEVTDAFTRTKDVAVRVRAAYGALGPAVPELEEVLDQLPERLVDLLVVSYLEGHRPVGARTLALLGVVESTPVPTTGQRPAHVRRDLRLDRLARLLDDPEGLLGDLYGWGAADLDDAVLFERLRALLTAVGVPAVVDPATRELRALILVLREAGTVPDALDLLLGLSDLTGADVQVPIGRGGWRLRLEVTGAFQAAAGLRVSPPFEITPLAPGVAADATLGVALERVAPAGGTGTVFGRHDGTRLEAAAARVGVGARFQTDGAGVTAVASVEGAIEEGRLVVSFAGADGFLSSFFPTGTSLDLDVAVVWDQERGVSLNGGAGLATVVPLALGLGPLRIEEAEVAFRLLTTGLTLEVRATGGIDLGPISASVDRVGAAADLAFRDGNLGIADLTSRFLPPTGLGLSIDAGPVSGGGSLGFDEPNGRYGGTFEVSIGIVGVQATGLLDTRLPGGGRGYALLVLMRASFPPIQVGFGFALSSVGGLLALNRRIDVDALRERMATGTAGRILAPEDPVRNAPLLLADLSAVFPPAEGVVVVGPTLQISWAELVRFDIGVFIELPGPRKVVLLGSARAAVENPGGGRPYLQIRLDVLGVVDIARQVLAFDAVLVDSHLLEILQLSGGAAFRLSWGAEPYVVLTVGGFHPAYDPAPLVLPSSLTRVAMVRGAPTDLLYLRFEGYFAVTTNSLQLGASVEAIINLGPFNIRGFLGFDALIRFQPLHFRFSVEASVKVRWKSHDVGGLELRGELSGPGPVVFRGRVCFEILWFDICFEETITLGSSSPPAVTPVASALAELLGELEDPRNVRAVDAVDRWVVVEPADGASLPVVSPLGQAVWSQERAPLGLLLQRFEGAPLLQAETVTATGPQVTGPEVDWFAPGGFTELGDADALNRRAFERLTAGVRLGVPGTDDGPAADEVVDVKVVRLPAPAVLLRALTLPAWLLRAAAGRTGAVERDVVAPRVAVRDEEWAVHSAGAVTGGLSQAQAHQLATVAGGGAAVAAVDTVGPMAF
ncbi:DUF6603 domain-containing protein [Kineococcus sp. SYSU DK001]|uniref:DUF6603 domain-containing protein n=1 Tax=Kineococcus sp. SYSU DK001 TaxID=3383122 RepID=UPI003D7E72FF